MPFYQVHHSYPLTKDQKRKFAEAITKLHSYKFKTPSLFVNVIFHDEDASTEDYFMAGVPRPNATNRIIAIVRTSEMRTKKHFDELAEKIESAWFDVVTGEVQQEGKDKGKRIPQEGGGDETETNHEAKKLLFVVFTPMISARENGVVIPGAGEEGTWLKDNMTDFKNRAEHDGDQDFIDMLKEVDEREDLKGLIS